MPNPPVNDRLSTLHFEVDARPHIEVDAARCSESGAHPCLAFCPSGCFTADEQGRVSYYYVGCLECGSCLIVCDRDAVRWNYPRGGFGISYRY